LPTGTIGRAVDRRPRGATAMNRTEGSSVKMVEPFTMNPPDNPLKVAFVHQPWSIVEPPVRVNDSIARVTDEVARCLVDRRCDVICYSRKGKRQPRNQVHNGVKYHRLQVSIDRWVKKSFDILSRRGWENSKRPFYSSKWCYQQFILQVAEDLQRQHPDVVHLHNFSQFIPFIRKACPDAKIVIHMHCEWLNRLDPAVIGPRLAQVDMVVGVSEYITNLVRVAFPAYAHKCQTVYNGVDIDKFHPSSRASENGDGRKSQRLIFIGRVSPEKGLHVLVDAFGKVRQRFPDACLDVLGGEHVQPKAFYLASEKDNPLRKSLEPFYHAGSYMQQMKARAGGSGNGITFHGDVDHVKIAQILATADLFVQPSVWNDPSPLTLYEAMAAGLPIVATRVGGQPEIVEDGLTGLIVASNDPAALADAIVRMLEDTSIRESMGDAGRRRARASYTWQHVADELLSAYEHLLDHRPADAPKLVPSTAKAS
jgi:glycosyltransferase involved in cell wall biosynthesis